MIGLLLEWLPRFILNGSNIRISLSNPFSDGFELFQMVLFGLIIAPILEEIIFRGPILAIFYVYRDMDLEPDEKIPWNFGLGAIVPIIIFWSALVWALLHLGNYSVCPVDIHRSLISIAWGGIVYGFITYCSRSLLPTMFLHFFWNFAIMFLVNF